MHQNNDRRKRQQRNRAWFRRFALTHPDEALVISERRAEQAAKGYATAMKNIEDRSVSRSPSIRPKPSTEAL